MFLGYNCAQTTAFSDPARVARIEASSHFSDGKFESVQVMGKNSLSAHTSAAWDFLFRDNNRVPDRKLPVQPVDLAHFNTPAPGQLNATWLGHSSLMIHLDGYKILTDPVFEKRISLVGPSRFNGAVPVDIEAIGNIDVVVISHNHYDHLNKASICALKEKTQRFIVPLAVGALLEKWGVARDRIVELDWWEEYRFDDQLTFVATPAQHFSGRGLMDRNKTLWASWVVKGPTHRIFFSGDSGYFSGFKKIGEKYGPFDMTFMECGAYDPAWHAVHMFPEETVQAHLDLGGRVLHPIHWGTFNLSLHSWFDPMERLSAAAALNNVTTALPVVGETTVYPARLPSRPWWNLN
ncbi:MAG: MBL fold metallo-hydrolase [Desulfobacterales bacterium]|nr:MBL fold metallo-hydrolase [Desulfobacterales bacterium]